MYYASPYSLDNNKNKIYLLIYFTRKGIGVMFERGSEWRRWDLHINTPETKENDQYPGSTPEEKWNIFYNAVNKYFKDGSDIKKIRYLAAYLRCS